MKKYQCFALIMILLLSCNINRQEIKWIDLSKFILYKYSDNKLLSATQFLIQNGDTILDGISKEYYQNGQLKSVMFFRNGVWDSIGYKYYRDGTIAGYYNRYMGIPFGKQVEYYPNGQVRNISLSSGKDTLLFYIHFDKNGNVKSKSDIGPLYINMNKNPIKVNDTFKMSFIVIEERNYKTIVHFIGYNPDGKERYNERITHFDRVGENDFKYFISQFKNAGDYKFKAVTEFIDTNRNTILLRDSFDGVIHVIP